MPKTEFHDGTTLVTASFLNRLYRTDGGHKHDGIDSDGHASKIDLNTEFTVGSHGTLAAPVDSAGEHKLVHAHATSGVARLVSGIMQAGRGLRVGLSAPLSTGAEADGDLQLVAGNGLDPATGVLELARRAGHALLTRSALKVDALRVALSAPPAGMEAAAPLVESLYKGNLCKLAARVTLTLSAAAAPVVASADGYNIAAAGHTFTGSAPRRFIPVPLEGVSDTAIWQVVVKSESDQRYLAQLLVQGAGTAQVSLHRWNGLDWIDALAATGAGISDTVTLHLCAW